MTVQVIQATQQARNNTPSTPSGSPALLRVCGYARVSTDEQDGSYQAQLQYFTKLINDNPQWTFCGMYADEGISGTGTKKRTGFNDMIRACEEHKIDIIVCKSISRFSRNVVDAVSNIRKLTALGVNIWMQKENIWTMAETSEFLMVILSSLAQAESQSTSINCQLGIRYRFQQGIPMINCTRFLGYNKDPVSRKLVIDPEGAAIVRYIYRAFLERLEPEIIAKRLREQQVRTATGSTDWTPDSIRYILTNEKYVGDLLMQKTRVESFLTHKVVKNTGQLPQYYVQDAHDPIVPRDVWNLAQYEIARRGKSNSHPGQRKYALTGKVICGRCGSEFKRFAGQRYKWCTISSTSELSDAAASSPAELLPAGKLLPAADTAALVNHTEQGDETAAAVESTSVEASTTVPEHVEQEDTIAHVEVTLDRPTQEDVATPTEEGEEDVATLDPTEEEDKTTPSPLGRTESREKVEKIAIFTPVWKCRARYDAKSAAKVAPRKYNPKRSVSGTWRCDNRVVDEDEVILAVRRALEMLPGEVENIRHIQEQAREMIATAAKASKGNRAGKGRSTVGSSTACDGTEPNSRACGTDGNSFIARRINKKVAAAQLLLLHTCTALRFLGASCDGEREDWFGDRERNSGRGPLRDFEEFAEMEMTMTTVSMKVEAMDLIDAVVVDGDEIRVRFKAGVEI